MERFCDFSLPGMFLSDTSKRVGERGGGVAVSNNMNNLHDHMIQVIWHRGY